MYATIDIYNFRNKTCISLHIYIQRCFPQFYPIINSDSLYFNRRGHDEAGHNFNFYLLQRFTFILDDLGNNMKFNISASRENT